MSNLPLSIRKRYWQSLAIHEPVPDPRLYPGMIRELRAALRDALMEIPDHSQPDQQTPQRHQRQGSMAS